MTTQITVIGLDQIGASIGLALADYKDHIVRVGHDSDSAKMKRLEKESAFDKTFTKLSESVHGRGFGHPGTPGGFDQRYPFDHLE